MLKVAPIITAFAIAISIMWYLYPPSPDLSSIAHAHAAFMLVLDGKTIDLAKPEFMVKDQLIHLESLDGNTIHRHAREVDLGQFFKSVGMSHDNITNCFTDTEGKQYCNDPASNKKLRFWINGEELNGRLENHVIAKDDRILVVYGNEGPDQIKQYLDSLNAIQIRDT